MRLSVRRPDDFHVHFRNGDFTERVVPATSRAFARALVMPNTVPPIVTAEDAARYKDVIRRYSGPMEPLMTVQLLESTTRATVLEAKSSGVVAAKFYPRGATTNSGNGVRDLLGLTDALSAMEECGLVLCLHGEVPEAFSMDREKEFLWRTLLPLSSTYPRLKIVLEHVSTEDAVECVKDLPENVAATVTVQHMIMTLDDVLGDRLMPHHFCKPILKRPADMSAVRAAATSGDPKFFFGSDTAPHPVTGKECEDACAGIFSAPVAVEALATIFEEDGRLDALERFMSENGARFYGLPLNEGKIELRREPFVVPSQFGTWFKPYLAGRTLPWTLQV